MDRRGADLPKFRDIWKKLKPKSKLKDMPKVLFELCLSVRGSSVDDDTAPVGKLIEACVACHSEVTYEERINWLFDTFSRDKLKLNETELEQCLQFVSIAHGSQVKRSSPQSLTLNEPDL